MVAGVLLANPPETKAPLFTLLERAFGPIDRSTAPALFDKTDYYSREMGSPLFRVFISFAPLVDPGALPEIKRSTNAMEAILLNEKGGRRVNIDPGLLTLQNFVLATTKNYSHRIYLSEGIYGDLTLIFQNGQYRPLPWTYPDYRDEATRRFLRAVRETYKAQLKERKR